MKIFKNSFAADHEWAALMGQSILVGQYKCQALFQFVRLVSKDLSQFVESALDSYSSGLCLFFSKHLECI